MQEIRNNVYKINNLLDFNKSKQLPYNYSNLDYSNNANFIKTDNKDLMLELEKFILKK